MMRRVSLYVCLLLFLHPPREWLQRPSSIQFQPILSCSAPFVPDNTEQTRGGQETVNYAQAPGEAMDSGEFLGCRRRTLQWKLGTEDCMLQWKALRINSIDDLDAMEHGQLLVKID